MTQRTDRLDELLRQEIGAMLEKDVNDPRIGFATVTKVETTPDLRHAKVWISLIGRDAERAEALTALEHSMSFIRRELGTRLRLMRIPDLHVRLDESIERGTRILTLIDAIESGVDPGDAPDGESLPTPKRGVPATADVEAAPEGRSDVGPGMPAMPTLDLAPLPGAPRPRDEGFGGAAADYAAALAAEIAARRARPMRGPGRSATGESGHPRHKRG